MLGMSVVGSDYDELKRFNLAELSDVPSAGDDKAPEQANTADKAKEEQKSGVAKDDAAASDQAATVVKVVEEPC